MKSFSLTCLSGLAAACLLIGPAHAAPTVYSAVGATAADIQATVDAFRAALGANNGVGPCAGACVPGVGRREVNWDAVPDAFASGGPNLFPGNFFNLASGNPAGRVRGIQFSTPGSFEVSADANNPTNTPVLFGNHTPDNADDFAAFSAERIFGLVGANTLDVRFAVPGSPNDAATVRGFGVIFTDVESAGTGLDFYDLNDTLLLHVEAQPFAFQGNDSFDSFSFIGANFDAATVARVRITNGGYDLALRLINDAINDATAMDDFIFGEPNRVSSTGTAALSLLGLGLLGLARRRRG